MAVMRAMLLALAMFSVANVSCDGITTPTKDTCGRVAPCGGDLVGTWSVSAICSPSQTVDVFPGNTCEGSTTDISKLNVAGTLSFKADGTYASDSIATGEVSAFVPSSCTPGVSCAVLTLGLQMLVTEPMSQVKAIACVNATGGCNCNVTYNGRATHEMGTYETNGTKLTQVNAAGPTTNDYCVQGSHLHLTTGFDMAMGKATADVVLTR